MHTTCYINYENYEQYEQKPFSSIYTFVCSISPDMHKVWLCSALSRVPDSKVHEANMGSIWGRQDPGGSHVGAMAFVIWRSLSPVTRCTRII